MSRRLRAEAPSRPTWVRLSPRERERARKAAEANRQKFSEFCRDAIVTAVEDCLEDDSSTDIRT